MATIFSPQSPNKTIATQLQKKFHTLNGDRCIAFTPILSQRRSVSLHGLCLCLVPASFGAGHCAFVAGGAARF